MITKFRRDKILQIIDEEGDIYSCIPCTKVEFTAITRVVKVINDKTYPYSETVFELPAKHKLELIAGHIYIKR